MGCHKLTYYQEEETEPFLGFWKKVDLEEKYRELKKCDYYSPFGLNINALSSTAPLSKPNNFKFNGNEEQTEFDVNLYDFNTRMYDAATGRFASVDLLADIPLQYNQSPYQFSWNNPILLNDPSGLCPDCPDPNEAKKGDSVSPNGEEYVFDGSEWVRQGGNAGEVVVTASATGSYEEPMYSDGTSAGGFRVGGYASGSAGFVNGEAKGFGVEYKGHAQGWGAQGRLEAHALDGAVEGQLGNEDKFAVGVRARGNILMAELDGGIGKLEGGSKEGYMLGGNAGAYLAKGEVSPGISLFGYRIGITVGGSAGSAHIGGEVSSYRDNATGTNTLFKAQVHAGLGVGFKLGINISSSPRIK